MTADVSMARERQEDAEHISGLATDSLQELEVKYEDDIGCLNSLLQVGKACPVPLKELRRLEFIVWTLQLKDPENYLTLRAACK